MQYYDIKLRLAGSTMNEVRKRVSAPEFLILGYVHGSDAMTDVKLAKAKNTNNAEEKNRLRHKYDQDLIKRDQSIDKIFGPLGSVPTSLPSDIAKNFEALEDDAIISLSKHSSEKTTQKEQDNLNNILSEEEIDFDNIIG